MATFRSFDIAPAETRRILRRRFASRLAVAEAPRRFLAPDVEMMDDQHALRLLANLRIEANADWAAAERTYAAAAPNGGAPADLEAAAQQGWVRKIWERLRITRDLRQALRRRPRDGADAVEAVIAGLYQRRYHVDRPAYDDPALTDLAGRIEAGAVDPETIATRSPDWVAARLWELERAKGAAPAAALRHWTDLWGLLQHPAITPTDIWSDKDAGAFQDAAIEVIASEAGLGDWAATRRQIVRLAALINDVAFDVADRRFDHPPATTVDRALWLDSPMLHTSVHEAFDICGDLIGLVGLLFNDLDAADQSPAPHPLFVRIIDLALDRPELLAPMMMMLGRRPQLLADLVIHPPTAALACLLIAKWFSPAGAWDRSLVERDHKLGQAEAFADAASLLGAHLRDGRMDVGEAAALFSWLHQRAGRGWVDDDAGADPMMTAMRSELTACPHATLLTAVQTLDGPAFRAGVGGSAFAAVLDLIALGDLAADVDAEALIETYTGSIEAGDFRLSAHRIGVASAVALFQVAARTPARRAQFLHPIDVSARLAAAGPDRNPYSLADSLGRALRAHMRVLCRAVIGSAPNPPADLFDALVAAVRTGAVDNEKRGRIAAFAPRFEQASGLHNDRPLSADLAGALAAAGDNQRSRLMAAILETDEPLLLAQLMAISPAAWRDPIERRIEALAPTDAGEIWSFPEMQARIDGLLTAGAADAAARYMDAEANLRTRGPVQGRELPRFQNQLRLDYLREDWSAIANTPEPAFPAPLDQTAAMETLRHFRALTALKGPNPNPAWAKTEFAALFAARPSPNHAANWFAAAISALLQNDSFGLLQGFELRDGQQALAEIDRMSEAAAIGAAEEGMECNRALLLLALGEPAQALAVLSTAPLVRLQDTAAAYRAIALSRLGRKPEAIAALDDADRKFGGVAVLAAARRHLANGSAEFSPPTVWGADNQLETVASAIARFRLMNPTDQAQVIQPRPDPFTELLVDYVRAAADAVVSLVPMMKDVVERPTEDGVTTMIQYLLEARVHFLGWSVKDQSRGGYSETGNAGERDLVIGWGSSVLGIIEAAICDRSLAQDSMRAYLESHFQKLLGYGNPAIFFHLTYAYIDDLEGVRNHLESIAASAAPPKFTYLGQSPIPHQDSRPPGFVARYAGDFGEIKVVFLVLNLGQQRQVVAAAVAAATRTRKAPPREAKPTREKA